MKLMKTEEAVGQVLCHDITQIIPGVTKDAVFRKGHIITKEDIPVLLSVGKEHIYIWEKDEHMLHENEAAQILYEMCRNDHMHPSAVKEGKIELIAECDGLFKVDREKLRKVNSLEIKPLQPKKAAILTTGSEVYHGRIQDKFTPVLVEKLKEYGSEVIFHEIYDDDHEAITKGCLSAIEQGAELVLCTGGMSVDPDDKTPLAIKNTGARIVSYGAPVLPGAMFLVSYYEYKDKTIPIVGLPGCVMYAKRTIFDLALPRLLADDFITADELALLGEGGLCLNCPVCTYPNCGFGKGW